MLRWIGSPVAREHDMSRLLHARPWRRATFFLALLCVVAAQAAPVASAQQATRQEQEQREQDPDERATEGKQPKGSHASDSGTTTLLLTPSRFEVAVGSRVRLTLSVLDANDLRRLPVTIRFDPKVVQLVSVDLGAAWDLRPEPVFLHDSSRPGELVVGIAQLNRDDPGIFGFVEVLELEFRAIGRGNAGLVLDRFAAITGGATVGETTALAAEIVVR